MFGNNTVEYRCETQDVEKLRDYMEYAHRQGYKCKYSTECAAGMHYYVITLSLSRYDVEHLAISALIDETLDFHMKRNKERNSLIEDARRDGYAAAVNDMTEHKAQKSKTKND